MKSAHNYQGGLSTGSRSTPSRAIVVAGKSIKKFVSRICICLKGEKEERGIRHTEHVTEIGASCTSRKFYNLI
jgi:hypothetical protein